MTTEETIVIMNQDGDSYSFELKTISAGNIPDVLNGENGRHVIYMCLLTELIARNLAAAKNGYRLTEGEICALAQAASLHDIGKSQIPRSILEKEGTLTPLEYDIVKRHSILGEELLNKYGQALPPNVLKYAKEITRHHHERYDGTGYPDQLLGDEIPISAQIVSIADAYEALTTDSSYKKAKPQDVALEMIANGMCGVFNPLLVDALMQAVDHEVLANIRKSVLSGGTVYEDGYELTIRKVLLMGNTRYITEGFLDTTFPQARVTILGKTDVKNTGRCRVYDQSNTDYEALLSTYDFDIIIYFAEELTYDSHEPSDAETLRQILAATKYCVGTAKFLYLASLDAAYEEHNDRGMLAAAKEELCLFYAKQNEIDIKIVRIPYLYRGAAQGDYLYGIFEQMRTGERIEMNELADSRTYFLSTLDLAELLLRITDSWIPGTGILTVRDEFQLTFGELSRKIAKLNPKMEFAFNGRNAPKHSDGDNTALKKRYNWFARISIAAELEEEYEAYLASIQADKKPIWKRFKEKLRSYDGLVRTIEVLVLFLFSEYLTHATDSTLFFSIVDFRLIYIVIMATLHGMSCGLSAGALSSFAWFYSKVESGISWTTLLYEPSNWLAFIFYLLVGAICGYVKLRKETEIRFAKESISLLEEKLAYTREMYEDAFREKQNLKKQIIGSKDSFGKIFEITRQFNTVDSRELYLKIIESFEQVLENRYLSVYSVNEGSRFARLEVASRDIIDEVSRSISLETYEPVMETLRRDEVWRNSALLPGMPMFACGIFRDDKPLLLIFLWKAQEHQQSLYYVNLFRILCDLAQISLLRAHDYNMAVYEKQYIAGTRIQNAEAFESNLATFRSLEERKTFRYILMEVEPGKRSPEEMSEILSKCVRANDIIGMMPNGKYRILFSQAGAEDMGYILPRFEKQGLEVRVLK